LLQYSNANNSSSEKNKSTYDNIFEGIHLIFNL